MSGYLFLLEIHLIIMGDGIFYRFVFEHIDAISRIMYLTSFVHCFWFFFFESTAHREMRTTTNYYLLNLSVADLLMSAMNCMFNFIYMLFSDWPFGSVYCTVNNFMGNVTVATSVFTLVAISFNRYAIHNNEYST